jgi:hypothetical protein
VLSFGQGHNQIEVGDMRNRIGISAVVVALTFGGALVAVEPAGAAAVHTVTVTPSTGLSDGQTVTVSGTGFDETPIIYDWAVSQCSAAILAAPTDLNTAINECNQQEPFLFTHADAAGNVSSTLVVHKTITVGVANGAKTVTCGQAPNDCAVLVAQLTGGGILVGAAAPISFGTPTPTLGDCIRDFLGDHHHGIRYRFHRLLVCIFTVLTHHRPD